MLEKLALKYFGEERGFSEISRVAPVVNAPKFNLEKHFPQNEIKFFLNTQNEFWGLGSVLISWSTRLRAGSHHVGH